MPDKNLYINDLVHRFASHTFTETVSGDLNTVAFKNASGVTIDSSRKMKTIDCYASIRFNLLGSEPPHFLCNATQRDAITSPDKGLQIFNITSGRDEVYDGSGWISSAGSGVMAPTAYGSMYESNGSGSAMDSTNKTWITASAGVFDGNGLITFLNDAGGDRLVIGTDGAGDYMIVASCGQTNSGGNVTTMTIHRNGLDETPLQDDQNSSPTNHRSMAVNGILALADADYITLHLVSSVPANTVSVYDCHLTIQRIS